MAQSKSLLDDLSHALDLLESENARLLDDNACLQDIVTDDELRIRKVLDENAKLREERDEWCRVAASKQDIIDHMRDTSSSNMRLRELARDMFDGMCDHDCCDICPHWQEGYNGCEYHARMRALGVEVNK